MSRLNFLYLGTAMFVRTKKMEILRNGHCRKFTKKGGGEDTELGSVLLKIQKCRKLKVVNFLFESILIGLSSNPDTKVR